MNIFRTLSLFGCLAGVITTFSQVTVIPTQIDTVIVLDTVVDTSPVVELKPFEINTDINNETTKDLKDVLQGYEDGRLITIQKESLANRTGQAFYIYANDRNVVLKYTTKQSLENAVYTYLDLLDIHWYGAGENWLYKPTILTHANIAGEWKEPTFRNRIFAGTGGLEFPLSIDPNYNYRNNWYTWKRRNRFNYDFSDAGHVGDVFYQSNREILDKNPHWFNSAQGKRYGRLRIENDSAMAVYKAWAKTQYNPASLFNSIGTDPEDGRGGFDDPLPFDGFQGINKWNHSDKWWWLTNEVAKMYEENNGNVQVNANAYGDGQFNALVPKFTLRKNVYPIIIPYAFQTAYLPKQMVKTWAKFIDGKMGIYDYWNITQWSLGLPQFNIYEIPEKLSFWKANKVGGMNIETTDASGPMGHAWWLAGQLEWDLSKNINTLFKKYLKDCFGAGWQSMKRMYDRWSLNYQQSADVNFSLKDLKEATDVVAVNSPEWKRLNDVKAYVHFMKLMAERTNTKSNNDSLYYYMYSIHERMLVQTVALTGQRYLGTAPEPLTAHQLTEQEIETNFVADLASLPVEYGIRNMVFDYDKAVYVDSIPIDAWKFGIFSGGYFKANYTGIFSIDMGGEGTTGVRIFTDDSIYVNENVSPTDFTFLENINGRKWSMKNYVINVVAGQVYNISTYYGFGRIRVRTPNIIIFNRPSPNDFDNAQYPNRYFYVPIGTKKIAYLDGEPQPMNGSGYLVTPDGISLVRTATTAKGIYTVDVPEGADGKVWTASFGHSNWSLSNIPNISALQRFSYKELQ